MKPTGSPESAFTVLEAFIVVCLIAILIALTISSIERPHRYSGFQTLSNMRQLYTASFQMALDGVTTGNTNLGWPGNLEGNFARWAQTLVAGNYLATNDLVKLLSGPGRSLPRGKIPTNNDTAILVYATKTGAESTTIFLTSANFTNTPNGGAPPATNAGPFGRGRFVVFRMGGDGAIYYPKQAGNTNVIGTFVPLCR